MRINKLICLALLCALCVGETWAQRGKRAMNRIDREVQETVFIPKGTWMAGGTVSYSEHDEGNLNFLVLKNVEGKGYNFGVSPYVGYFFRNNISAGMRFAYHRDYLYYLEHKYEVSGFLRTYMPIGRSKIFGLFNEARLTYGYGTGKNSTGTGATYDGSYQTAQNLQIGIAPGMTAFITDWSAVEVSVGVMGFDFKWIDQKTNQIEEGHQRVSSGNFKINLFSINIGMTFYL